MSSNALVFALFVAVMILLSLPAEGNQHKKPKSIDYAKAKQVDSWLRHPVYGDPSFDSFKRRPGNPIHRGSGDFSWPVNGYLFIDPISKNWYIYVGEYYAGYLPRSRCVLLKSTDQGKNWKNLGPVVKGDKEMFDEDGHTPDATVVYDGGRYHMTYDWGEYNFNAEGGLAYAWADKPEGPWHRAKEPLTRISNFPKLIGRYYRTYGPMLIRRKNDWLLLTLLDYAPYGWAVGAMTAKHPEGPYSACKLVRNVESDYFHPPLMEFFPTFVHDGWVYATATSVALNRNFDAMFRAPVERADDAKAWELYRYGSSWHAEDIENEYEGLWGQTYSGQVLPDGRFIAVFNSRDPQNRGTVNVAERLWAKPLRKNGFVMSGHGGPSFTCINRSYDAFTLRANMKVRGTARVLWGYQGAIGPDKPTSDATLHPLTLTRYAALELSDTGWKVVVVDALGKDRVQGEGTYSSKPSDIEIKRGSGGQTQVSLDGKEVWSGTTSASDGPLGLTTSPRTHLEATRFELEGESQPAHWNVLFMEGLVGAAEPITDWDVKQGTEFRYGVGAVHHGPGGMLKWNFYGSEVRLWSPTGPDWGKVKAFVDGHDLGVVDLHSNSVKTSTVVFEKKHLRKGYHCLVLRSVEGLMVVDGVEVVAEFHEEPKSKN